MIISKTPYRISFFGGGTDYPSWYLKHGGAVLASTIDKYCYLTCRYLPPFFEHKHRIVWSQVESVSDISEIKHPVIPKAIEWLGINEGLEIHHDGDLPARSGMGSSSSFVVGLLNALGTLKGKKLSKRQLLEQSLHMEQDILNESVGSQDQTLAAYGGFNKVLFQPNGKVSVLPVTVRPEKLRELNDNLMLFFSGISRTASSVATQFINSLAKKESHLLRMYDMVDEGLKILCEDRDIDQFGYLLNESWMLKRSLNSAISTNTCDAMYARAIRAGALGGKILGAGGGGFMLFYVPPEKQNAVTNALSDFVHVPFNFEYGGSQIILNDNEHHTKDLVRLDTSSSSKRIAMM